MCLDISHCMRHSELKKEHRRTVICTEKPGCKMMTNNVIMEIKEFYK